RLLNHLIDEILFRLLTSHPRDLFQLLSRFVHLAIALRGFVLDALFSRLDGGLPPAQVAISFINRIDPLIQTFFFANQSFFECLELSPGLSHLLLKIHFFLYEIVLDLYLGLFFNSARVLFSLLYYSCCCVFCKLYFFSF